MGFKTFMIGKGAEWLVSLVLKKADVAPYAVEWAKAVDKALDKQLGDKSSEKVQDSLVVWINKLVNSFTQELQVERRGKQ